MKISDEFHNTTNVKNMHPHGALSDQGQGHSMTLKFLP